MKYLVLVMDGAADWPVAELGAETPLGAAVTPNLDALASLGRVGLAQTVPSGTEPSSSAACTSILGFDPIECHVGRGAIEAASLGIDLAPDEVALRMNLVTTTADVMTSYACGHIRTDESAAIVAELQAALGDSTFRFHPGVAYRHILVVKGCPELMGLGYTPPHDISDKPIDGERPRGDGAEVLLDLMTRAREVLEASPVNRARLGRGDLPATDIWPFWPGVAPAALPRFTDVRGVSAALTSGVDLLNGLATLFGITRLALPGVTDGADNDYAAQMSGSLDSLSEHDLVVVHVESPDEEGHAGDLRGKIEAIEAIDREMVGALLERLDDVRVLVMPDHPTPVEIKTHVGEPVPFLLAGPGIEPDAATVFTEAAGTRSGWRLDPGHQVMDALLS
jgi:2,3-bisphosphoglycerate-independent phosphoglycerate mutase